ncbi:MAG: hypothetical protein IJO29_01565 [Oscillospiraceae bacterium]|nr:hypothetical protein [Oscillospiraceae bacterium]
MSLPIGYKHLTGIEATGTQYIDTGVNVTSSNHSQLRLIVDELIKSTSGWSVSGCGTAGCIFFVGAYNGTIYYGNGGNYSTGISYPYKRCLFDLDAKNGTYTVDAVASQERIVDVSSISTGSFSKLYPINLFRYSGDNGYHSGIIYGAKIYEDDILIRDFVPAERLSDGEIGLYDIIGDTFYANAGTGSFIDGTPIWRISDGYPYIDGLDIPSAFSYTEPYPKWAWRIRNGSYPYLAPLSTTRTFPSENYIKAVRKPTRQTKITGQVTLGDTLMITIDNDIIKSLSKSNSCMNSDLFLPGAANAAEFNLDIRLPTAWTADNFYSTRISLSFWILTDGGTDGGWEECPLGSFTPSEVTKSSPGFVKILGYDDMIRLKDIAVSGDIFNEYGHFNTAYGWLKAISEYSGIPLCQSYEELSALPNADIEIMIGSFAEIKTLWDAL